MKRVLTTILFLCCLGMVSYAQLVEENLTKFQQEYQALQDAVQQKLTQIEVDYEKEVAEITQQYKAEIVKLQAEFEGNPVKSAVSQKKYKKEAGKINSKYDLKTKDVIFKSTVKKAKVENEYYHERNKLMIKYDIFLDLE